MGLILKDNALAPQTSVEINYVGPNPFQTYSIFKKIAEVDLKLKGKDILEEDFRWDITEDPRPFLVRFKLKIGFDKFSKGLIFVELRGKQPTIPEENGEVKISLSAHLETKYNIKKILIPLIYLYHLIFYNSQRRKYLNDLKKAVDTIVSGLKDKLKLK